MEASESLLPAIFVTSFSEITHSVRGEIFGLRPQVKSLAALTVK